MARTRLRPIPGRDKLDELARRALAHAGKQVASAEILLDHDAWPAAHAMATLAFEELGKAMLCLVGTGVPERERLNDWFWPAFNGHRQKLTIARFVLAMCTAFLGTDATPSQPFPQVIDHFGVLADADHNTKMRGLYVDYRNDDILDPADVSEREARAMVGNVRVSLEVLTQFLIDADLAAELSAFMATMAAKLDTLVDSPDVDVLALTQEMWDGIHAGGPPKPPWELLPGLFPAPTYRED